jgi:hypothetical protein
MITIEYFSFLSENYFLLLQLLFKAFVSPSEFNENFIESKAYNGQNAVKAYQ